MDVLDCDLDYLGERPFSCLEPPLRLQNMAATKVALHLSLEKLHDKILHDRDETSSKSSFEYPMLSCREVLPAVPLKIREIIDESIVTIVKQLDAWEKHFWKAMEDPSATYLDTVSIKDLNDVLCKPDGTICMRDFATKVLQKANFYVMIRFQFACIFCLEDQIKEIWPSISGRLNKLEPSSLMYYWKQILTKGAMEESFLNTYFHNSMSDRNWAAFEYFWSKMTEEHQTREAISILPECEFDSMKLVLIKLNQNQVREVCQQIGGCIFSRFIAEEEHYDDTINAWNCIRPFLPDNVFVEIVRMLWNMVFNPSESEIPRIGERNVLLLVVWSSAPNSWKSSIPRAELFAELDDEIRGFFQHYYLKFMFELLSDTSYPLRKDIWTNNWRKLVIRAKPCDLERLMKLCFETDEEIKHSKDDYDMSPEELSKYFSVCMIKERYSELGDFLVNFVKNPRRLENLGKEFILSNLDRFVSCDEEELSKCYAFIHKTFRSSETANKFTNELISTPECLAWIYSKLDECCFDDVLNLFIRFPTTLKNLQEIKLELLEYCRGNFTRGKVSGFHEGKFTQFVSWCSPGEEKVSEFKNSIIIDDIFEIILIKFIPAVSANQCSRDEKILQYFQNFLRWYFGSLKGVRFYKTTKMLNYDEESDDVVMNVLRQGPEGFVNAFLNWAFEYDKNYVTEMYKRLGKC
ncbi:uncharacterized protein LOC135844958 isoform X7 [Planococcus citri]|uniref:uncharacterized protein LOC135844958 isoform X7 n=1 Tax=Planococcus citri TaxID=170843 RepID=UPI0031F9BFF5